MAEGVYGIAQQTKAETGRFGSINALKRPVFLWEINFYGIWHLKK